MDKPKVTPKDFFLHFGDLIALYWTSIALIVLLFQIINIKFPDPLDFYGRYSGALRFSVASIIVFFPVFIYLARLIERDIRTIPEKKDIWVRKWFIYFTLFVSGFSILGDVVALINTYLSGEITIRFIFKIVAVLAVAVLVFLYYIHKLKTAGTESRKTLILQWTAVALVSASVIGAFITIGSPTKARDVRADQTRIGDLSSVQQSVISFYQQKGRIPESLEELSDPTGFFYVPTDPVSKSNYEYRKTGELAFELCADFALSSADAALEGIGPTEFKYPGGQGENWNHDAGRKCFDRTIDPELYPQLQKGEPVMRPLPVYPLQNNY